MPVHRLVHLVQQQDVIVQLVAYLNAQLPLPPDRLAQSVKRLVLLLQHPAVILVDLGVGKVGLIRRAGVVGVVAVGEERRAVNVLLLGNVGEADGLVLRRCGALGFSGAEVGGEGGVVGLGDGV